MMERGGVISMNKIRVIIDDNSDNDVYYDYDLCRFEIIDRILGISKRSTGTLVACYAKFNAVELIEVC